VAVEQRIANFKQDLGAAVFEVPATDIRGLAVTIKNTDVTLLHVAAFYDCLDVFMTLEAAGIPYMAPSADGHLPLHFAILAGAREVAFHILGRNAQVARDLTFTGQRSMLYLAVVAGDVPILTRLLDCGADAEAIPRLEEDPVKAAIARRHRGCLITLLGRRRMVAQKGASRMTALMQAIVVGNREAALMLLDEGDDVNPLHVNPQTQEYHSALSLACEAVGGWPDVVEAICDVIDVSKMEPPRDEPRPGVVHWACASRSVPIIKAVCGLQGVLLNRVDKFGRCGLKAALSMPEAELIDVMRFLFDRGFTLQGPTISIVKDMLMEVTIPRNVLECLFQQGRLDPMWELPPPTGAAAQVTTGKNKPPHRLYELREWLHSREGKAFYDKYLKEVAARAQPQGAKRPVQWGALR
jgi:hypothetical protein